MTISKCLPAELEAELDRAIAAEGISRSDRVRKALRDDLIPRRFRALQAEMHPDANAQGVFTDEDVFRLVA